MKRMIDQTNKHPTDRIRQYSIANKNRELKHDYGSDDSNVRSKLNPCSHPAKRIINRHSCIETIASVFLFCLMFFVSSASADAFTVSGSVSGPFGAIEGATVSAYRIDGTFVGSGATDANGLYSLSIPISGIYELRASRSGYYESTNSDEITGDTVFPDFTLSPYPYITVKGYLRNSNGAPISGGLLKAKEGSAVIDQTFSASDGYYEMQVMDDSQFVIQSGANGYYTSVISISTDGNRQLDIALSPTNPSPSNPSGGSSGSSGSHSHDDDASTSSGSTDNRVWCGDTRCDMGENCKNCAKDCGRCENDGKIVIAEPPPSVVSTPVEPAAPPNSSGTTGVGVGLASSFLQNIDLQGIAIGIIAVITVVIILAFLRIVKKSI